VSSYLPALKAAAKELEKYPNAEFVDVQDASGHVRVSTVSGKLHVDVVDESETVHVALPVAAIRVMEEQLGERSFKL
jgi:polyisoprenoid-binding protein YceI